MSWIGRSDALGIEFCERTRLTESPCGLAKHVDIQVIENGYGLQPILHVNPQGRAYRQSKLGSPQALRFYSFFSILILTPEAI
jgi:hypothetical protein